MAWVVDTCILIDVLDDDPRHGAGSARLLGAKLNEGLVVCPITFIELAPAFNGSRFLEEEFLAGLGVEWRAGWTAHDTEVAFSAWQRHTAQRHRGGVGRRPIADILIGAYAETRGGLLTRNRKDFRPTFKNLAIESP